MRLARCVTLRWLKYHMACNDGLEWFIGKYGRDGKPTVQVVVKALWRGHSPEAEEVWRWNASSWIYWLLDEAASTISGPFKWWWDERCWETSYRRYRQADLRFARDYQRLADAQGKKKRKGKR